MLDNIDAIYNKEGQFIGYLRRSSIAELKEFAATAREREAVKSLMECKVPDPTETDPAKKILQEQHYLNCRFGSINKLLLDLQHDLESKHNNRKAASYVRQAMIVLKEAQDDYLLISRGKLSALVNDPRGGLRYGEGV